MANLLVEVVHQAPRTVREHSITPVSQSSVEIDRSCQAWCRNGSTYDTKQEVSQGNLF